jgi:capsular exopolysaccharide synthesis family protein
MEPVEYLGAFRRRWWVIALTTIIAGAVGWVATTATPAPGVPKPSASVYSATSVMWNPTLLGSGGGSPISDLGTLAELVSLPDVAVKAADIMSYDGDPSELSAQVNAETGATKRRDPGTAFLRITGYGPDPQTAEATARAFSRALVAYLGDLKNAQINRQQALLRKQLATLRAQGDTTGAINQITGSLTQLALSRATPISLTVIQQPVAQVVPTEGFKAPESRTSRMILAVLGGLLAGMALVLVMARFDTHLRTRVATEEAFDAPVLAEIPVLSRRDQAGIVTAGHLVSRAADAFRLLCAGLRRSTPGVGGVLTILVTSPEPGDGVTTVAANLAVAFAETGKRVFALSCDLRRPSVEQLFGVHGAPGVSDALLSMNGNHGSAPSDLTPYVVRPSGSTVAIMPSGTTAEAPEELLRSAQMQTLIEGAKKAADVVILDCVSLDMAGDVVPLLAQADAVVIVARAGKTRADVAERSMELLQNLGANVAGVVLNRVRGTAKTPKRDRRGAHTPKPAKQQPVVVDQTQALPEPEPTIVVAEEEIKEPKSKGKPDDRDMWVGRG